MLSVDDELPTRPQRVLVAGVSGVGKSTVARRLGSMLDVPYTEIDGLFHGENWIPRPGFLDDVRALSGHDGWVTEWQYASARGMLADRADLLVWLDLPFRVTFTRALRRTVSRRVRREVLWNGNVEPPLHTFFTSRDNLLRWAIATRNKYRELVPALTETHPDLVVVRLRTSREVSTWLARLGADHGRV